ncbi:MAG: transcription antitermination factor NusB [bacterium]|nr:transcription antitermination factor NusB [bacterium]MDT8395468.1 transcription antitermination factor NusB [bacterium]
MGSRRRGREAALKILYSMEMNPGPVEDVFRQVLNCGSEPEAAHEFAKMLAGRTIDRMEEIDGRIRSASLKWDLDRMAAVDRNVLRLAVSELIGQEGTPVRVVLNEAIELAKRYGGEESGTFINGILDRIRIDLGLEP